MKTKHEKFSRRLRRALAILLLPILAGLSGCDTTPDLFQDPDTGGLSRLRFGRDENLLAQSQGWRMVELRDRERVYCMAVKPADPEVWPRYSELHRTLVGGAGFYMTLVDGVGLPYFGFYGKYPHRWPATAEVDGQTVPDVNNRETVMAWEGKDVSFEVVTQPSAATQTVFDTASGTVDFTGVRTAFRIIELCHREI